MLLLKASAQASLAEPLPVETHRLKEETRNAHHAFVNLHGQNLQPISKPDIGIQVSELHLDAIHGVKTMGCAVAATKISGVDLVAETYSFLSCHIQATKPSAHCNVPYACQDQAAAQPSFMALLCETGL